MEIKYTGQKYYDIDLAGRIERLPITPVTPTLHIAGFVLLGNTNLTNYCAKVLGDKIKDGRPTEPRVIDPVSGKADDDEGNHE